MQKITVLNKILNKNILLIRDNSGAYVVFCGGADLTELIAFKGGLYLNRDSCIKTYNLAQEKSLIKQCKILTATDISRYNKEGIPVAHPEALLCDSNYIKTEIALMRFKQKKNIVINK
jgi:hypothetical protein